MDRSHSGLDPAKNWFVIEMNIPRTPRPPTSTLFPYTTLFRSLMGAGKEGAPDKGFADARVHRLPPRSRRRDGIAHAPVRRAPRGGRTLHRVRRLGDAPPVRGDRRGAPRRPAGRGPVRREPHGEVVRRGARGPRGPRPPERERRPDASGPGALHVPPPGGRDDPRRCDRDVPLGGPVLRRVQRGTPARGPRLAPVPRAPPPPGEGRDGGGPLPRPPGPAGPRDSRPPDPRRRPRDEAVRGRRRPRLRSRFGPPHGGALSTGNGGVGVPRVR